MKISILLASTILLFSAGLTQADDCKLSISANDAMQFDSKSLSIASSCEKVTLTLTHSGKLPAGTMGHNWVLSKTSDLQAVATAGLGAGLTNNYVPANDQRVIASTKVISGGESTSVTFSIAGLSSSESYTFFCSFPGHWSMMKGEFKITG